MGCEFGLLVYHASARTTIHELANVSYAVLVNAEAASQREMYGVMSCSPHEPHLEAAGLAG